MAYCEACVEKEQRIYELEMELQRLKQRLRWQERKAGAGYFGSNTPSAQLPFKGNSHQVNQQRQGGGRKGHVGHGRSAISCEEAVRVEQLDGAERCPYCQGVLEDKGRVERTVLETPEQALVPTVYQSRKQWCPRCRKTIIAKPPIFSRALYGNRLIAHALVLHFVHGLPCGQIERLWNGQVLTGSLHRVFHQVAQRWQPALETLASDYRKAPVKHADETTWRTDGQGGYVWLFCSQRVSLFRFAERRSAQVPQVLMGTKRLAGTLLVDRYAAYNRMPCRLQYCYAHLKRDVDEVGKQFPDQPEVQGFVSLLSPLLGQAMKLRNVDSTDATFYRRAHHLKNEIISVAMAPAQHPAILAIQNIFTQQKKRLYHWARDRTIPADNNRAERELRPTVIARKVSFGSQSKRGADTRSILMSVLHTAQKRLQARTVKGQSPISVELWLKQALDSLAANPHLKAVDLLPK